MERCSLVEKVDAFAHVLPNNFYKKMLVIDAGIPSKLPFIKHPLLQETGLIRKYWDGKTRQIISCVNINPEDYASPIQAFSLCKAGNEELVQLVAEYKDIFLYAVAMVPMNNIDGAIKLIKEQVLNQEKMVGIQLFTRALGLSIADEKFESIFAFCNDNKIPIWLHPVFDDRKPDNNIVFSWEYELSQAMLHIVQAEYFKKYPKLKIVVHHAGAMIPYFAERINYILGRELAGDFKKFYVDTALLGNPKAIELAVYYFGIEHVLFGTDAPLGIDPAGATEEIIKAIKSLKLGQANEEKIFRSNVINFINDRR